MRRRRRDVSRDGAADIVHVLAIHRQHLRARWQGSTLDDRRPALDRRQPERRDGDCGAHTPWSIHGCMPVTEQMHELLEHVSVGGLCCRVPHAREVGQKLPVPPALAANAISFAVAALASLQWSKARQRRRCWDG